MSGRRRKRRNPPQPLHLVLGAVAAVLAVAVIWVWLSGRGLPGKDIPVPDYVERAYLPANDYSRPGIALEEVNGIVVHYVGNPGTTAEANRNYFASLADGREDTYASSHFVVGLEGEVLQCIPLTEIAYASKDRNRDTIAIEVCHPDATGKFSPVTEEALIELTAWLCHTFALDPEEDVIRHYDVTGKLCPLYYVENPEDWDVFRENVTGEMNRLAESMEADSLS